MGEGRETKINLPDCYNDAMPYKYLFFDDYSEGAHPSILEALARTNLQQEPGYVMDSFAVEAAGFIRERFGCPQAEVHFVASGTQANLAVLSAILKPWESVIAAETGHINTHESGSVEATGHKVNTVKGHQGKVRPAEIEGMVEMHNFDQMVVPRAVYISQSTELGTVYTRAELTFPKSVRNMAFIFILMARDLARHWLPEPAILVRKASPNSSTCFISAVRRTAH